MNKTILIIMIIVTLGACNESSKEDQKKVEQTKAKIGLVEMTTFKLNKGVSNSDFVKAAEKMQVDFLAQQKGFIKRTLTNSRDTLWTDIVYWENEEVQDNAMKLAEKSTQIMPFMEKIDFNTVKMNLAKPIFTTE
jgi:hypothetical protein